MADIIPMPRQKQPRAPQPRGSDVYELHWAAMADKKLTPAAKCVLTALLFKFRNNETGLCNPGFHKLADVVGRGRRTVILDVNDLKAGGWVEVSGTKGGSKSHTNMFTFPLLLTNPDVKASADSCTSADSRTGAGQRSRGADSCTPGVQTVAHEPSSKPSNNQSSASANVGRSQADGNRAFDGSSPPCSVTRGSPAFDAWLAYFEHLGAAKMIKRMRECMATGEPVRVRSPLPPSGAARS